MRVLIASKYTHLGKHPIGGVQTWNCAIGDELERLGHEVVYWEPGFRLDGGFDLGILANQSYTGGNERLCSRVVKVSHGIIPDEAGGPEFFATSEEVAQKWGCEAGIIRQPMNLEFWSPGTESTETLVRHSYRQGLPMLTEIAASRGWRLHHLLNLGATAVRDSLRRAHVVIATGRAVVEAMATGVPVVIADHRGYQGPLLSLDTEGQMARNYSGRGGEAPTRESLDQAIDAAIERGSLRAHAEKHHDVRQIVDGLLA